MKRTLNSSLSDAALFWHDVSIGTGKSSASKGGPMQPVVNLGGSLSDTAERWVRSRRLWWMWSSALGALVRSLLLAGATIVAVGVLSGIPLYSGVAILCGLIVGLPAYFNARQTHALLELSLTDPLTAIGNRRALEIRLEEESARCARGQHSLSVLMIDVDKLKEINDKAGHRAGDEALRVVGRALRQSTRISDVVGRFGGDEFLVIAPDTSQEEACALGERIAAAARKESGNGPPLELSIGVAYAKSAGPDLVALLRSADLAMYEAKHRGGGRVVAAHDKLLADIVPIRPTAGP